MHEFELIRTVFREAAYAQPGAGVERSIGDDCALLNVPAGHQVSVSTDSLLEGVHFPADCDSFLLGQRALAVAVSDLAACGAEPLAFTLALSVPSVEVAWLQAFSRGLGVMAQQCNIPLAGGDTTAGPLNIGVTVLGSVPSGQTLLRSKAQVGELLFVSGPLGAAAAALQLFDGSAPDSLADEIRDQLLQAFWQPAPQLALGQWLRGKAGGVIDISDGLLADAGHIARESDVSLVIDQARVPVAKAARQLDQGRALEWALTGGDDYQLLFSLSADLAAVLQQSFPDVHCIGQVEAGEGVQLLNAIGRITPVGPLGYQHFAGNTHE